MDIDDYRLDADQKKRYLKNSSLCPFCLYNTLKWGTMKMEGSTLKRFVSCKNCGHVWLNTYILKKVEGINI